MSSDFLERTLRVGPFQCNCRLLVCSQTGQAALIDPGDEAERILAEVKNLKTPAGDPVQVKYLLHTHGHLDHIGAARTVCEKLPTDKPKIALHKEDEPLYLNLKTQGNLFGFQYDDPLAVDHFLSDEEEIQIGKLKFSVVHTPGHSPASVCFQFEDRLYSGDTLFQGSVGRTDLWGGNTDQMFRSIRQRLLILDDDTRVCPGHGPDTSIGIEKRKNPFLSG